MTPITFLTVSSIRLESGGPSRALPGLSKALAAKGWENSIFTSDLAFSQRLLEKTSWHSASYSFSRADRVLYAPRYRKKLFKLVNNTNQALIHDNGCWEYPAYAAALVARKTNSPLIITPRGSLTSWSFQHRSLRKKLFWSLFQRKALEQAACLHATSKLEAADLRALGLKAAIAVIPHGLDIPEAADNGQQTAQEALFLSRIHPKKGIENLLAAWEMVAPHSWLLKIVGPGDRRYIKSLKALSTRLGISERVSFLDPVYEEQKEDVFRAASVFILPTYSENFGVAIGEALAHGLPVITTNTTPWEDIETHKAGWYIDVGVESLVKALRKAVNTPPDELAAMGQRGRKLIEEKYSWDTVAQNMIRLYKWVLGEGERPDDLMFD